MRPSVRKCCGVVAVAAFILSGAARADGEPESVQLRGGMKELEQPATAFNPEGAQTGPDQFGQTRESGRDASEALDQPPLTVSVCPEGQVPVMRDGQPVLGVDGQPACKVKRAFVKGELTNLGASKLKVKDSRFGLRLGYARLDSSSWLSVSPELDMSFGKFSFGLGLPLHVRAYANGFVDGGGFHLRSQDYAQPSDYARIVRFLTYGAKEDNLYVNVSQLFAASIGHGAIVRRYSGNIDQNVTRVGAQIDAYGRFGGFEAFLGDVVQPTRFMSGLVFLKPLGFLSGKLLDTLGQTSIGISTALDADAPYSLKSQSDGCTRTGLDPATGDPWAFCLVQVDDKGVVQTSTQRRAQVIGVDLETKILKTEGADLKPYLDYSRLLGVQDDSGKQRDGGGGFTLGLLGRFNTGDVKLHAFRTVVEARYFDGNFTPSYFDTFYEVQKYQYITGRASSYYQPKLKTFNERDPAQKRLGFYVEAAYQYNFGLAIMLAYENSFQVSGPEKVRVLGVDAATCPTVVGASGVPTPVGFCDDPNKGTQSLTAHIEYPAYSWLQFFASFYRRSFGGFPFDKDHILGDNTLIYTALRLHVLPILFLNARLYRSWQPDPVLGEIKNVLGGEFDLEFGYEFDRRKKK